MSLLKYITFREQKRIVRFGPLSRAASIALISSAQVGCQSNFCDGPAKAWQRMQDAGRIREHLCDEDIGGARWCFGSYQTA